MAKRNEVSIIAGLVALSTLAWAQFPLDDFGEPGRFTGRQYESLPLGLSVTQAPGGVVVQFVRPGSAAANQLEPFDVIRAVNGREVLDEDDFARLVARMGPTLRLTVWKSRLKRDIAITLLAGEDGPGGGGGNGWPSERMLGIRHRFDVATGVTITDVLPGSPAARAGIVAGLNLVEINGKLMRSTADVEEAIGRGGALRLRLYDRAQERWQTMAVSVGTGNVGGFPPTDDIASMLGVVVSNFDQRSGVIVASVSAGGLAARAGIRRGDLIVAIDEYPTQRLEDLKQVDVTGRPVLNLTVRSRRSAQGFGPPAQRRIVLDEQSLLTP